MTLRPSRKIRLDGFDLKILSALAERGRMSKTELAEQAGLSATPCVVRMGRLEKDSYIRAYHADIDLERLAGLKPFWIRLRHVERAPVTEGRLRELIAACPFVLMADAIEHDLETTPLWLLLITATGPEQLETLLEPFRAAGFVPEIATVSRRLLPPLPLRLGAMLKALTQG
ncbi:MAG: Lrp/AsnC family transcriptional regulator [Asticcacaulis sp.]